MKKVYDPELIQKQIDSIQAADFGLLLAEVISEHPSSSNWMLVGWAIEKETGWVGEHEQIQALIARISGRKADAE